MRVSQCRHHMQVFELGGNMVAPSLADNLMRLVAEGAGEGYDEADAELRSRAAASYLSLLSKPKLPNILLKVLSLSQPNTPCSAVSVPANVQAHSSYILQDFLNGKCASRCVLVQGIRTIGKLPVGLMQQRLSPLQALPRAGSGCSDSS